MNDKRYYVYIMINKTNTVIYTGITSNLVKRISQHKNKAIKSFTQKYNINKLVYFEIFNDPENAIKREKQIKAGSRKKKVDLILSNNPQYEDLYSKII